MKDISKVSSWFKVQSNVQTNRFCKRSKSAKQTAYKQIYHILTSRKQELKWLNACMGMQWSSEQWFLEIISIHAAKENLAKPSPTLPSTKYFFHRHILKHSVLSFQSPAFKAALAAPKLLLVAIWISFIIVKRFLWGTVFTINTPNVHIQLHIHRGFFPLPSYIQKTTTCNNKKLVQIVFPRNWQSVLETIQ